MPNVKKSQHTSFTKLDPNLPGISDLAAELRLKLYEQLLAPTGYICFCNGRRTFDRISRKNAVNTDELQSSHKTLCHSTISTNVLLTCHQIKREAEPVLYEQNFSSKPTGPELDSPLQIVDRVKHAFVFLDSTADCNQMGGETKHIFAGMTSLKEIRIVSVEDVNDNFRHLSEWRSTALYAMLKNIPSDYKVVYGMSTEAETSFVATAKSHWEARTARHICTGRPAKCVEIEPQRLEEEERQGLERQIEGSLVIQSSAYPGMYMIFDDVVGM